MSQIIITCPDKIHNGAWRHGIELARNFPSAIEYIPTAQVMNMKIDAKLVIMIGGFCDDYRTINTNCQSKGIKTAMLFCSPFGQADINGEIEQLNSMIALLNTKQIDYLFTGTQVMADSFKNDKIKFLPQTLNYELYLKDTKTKNVTAQKNSVSLFCGKQPNKNILNQLIAAKLANKILITNALERRAYREFANNINLSYYQFTWTDDAEYKRLINSCEIGLQCSWDEAFDYVIADHYLLNRPIISGKYSWAHPELIVDDLSDTQKITKKLTQVTENLTQNYNLDLVTYAKNELDKRKKTAEETINSLEIWKW